MSRRMTRLRLSKRRMASLASCPGPARNFIPKPCLAAGRRQFWRRPSSLFSILRDGASLVELARHLLHCGFPRERHLHAFRRRSCGPLAAAPVSPLPLPAFIDPMPIGPVVTIISHVHIAAGRPVIVRPRIEPVSPPGIGTDAEPAAIAEITAVTAIACSWIKAPNASRTQTRSGNPSWAKAQPGDSSGTSCHPRHASSWTKAYSGTGMDAHSDAPARMTGRHPAATDLRRRRGRHHRDRRHHGNSRDTRNHSLQRHRYALRRKVHHHRFWLAGRIELDQVSDFAARRRWHRRPPR